MRVDLLDMTTQSRGRSPTTTWSRTLATDTKNAAYALQELKKWWLVTEVRPGSGAGREMGFVSSFAVDTLENPGVVLFLAHTPFFLR